MVRGEAEEATIKRGGERGRERERERETLPSVSAVSGLPHPHAPGSTLLESRGQRSTTGLEKVIPDWRRAKRPKRPGGTFW